MTRGLCRQVKKRTASRLLPSKVLVEVPNKMLGTDGKFLILIAFSRLAHAQLDVKLGVRLKERQIVGKEGHLLVINTGNSFLSVSNVFISSMTT
jgi:hypothetical protein